MRGIFPIEIFILLFVSCAQEKTQLAPAGANYFVGPEEADTTTQPVSPPPFQHVYLTKADSLRDLRDYNGAILLYQEAAAKFEQEENWEGKIKAVNEMSNLYYLNYEEDKAISLLLDILNVAKNKLQPLNHPIIADTHFYLGKCYNVSHEPRLSLYHHELALEIRNEVFGERSVEIAQSYKELGSLYLRRIRDFNLSENYLKKAASILELEAHPGKSLFSIYRQLASTYRSTGDFQKALEYYKTVLSLYDFSETKTSRSYLNTIADLANVYIEMEEYNVAKELYQNAIDSTIRIFGPNDLTLGGYYNNLGSIYTWELKKSRFEDRSIRKQFYDSANLLFQRSKEIGLRFNDPDLLSDSYFSLGWNHSELQQTDSALYYFDLCEHLQIIPKEFIYRQIGDVYLELDSCSAALNYYQKSLTSNLEDFSENSIYENPKLSPKLNDRETYQILFRKGPAFNKLYHKTKNEKALKAALETYLLMDKINDYRRNSAFQEESKLFLIDYHQKKFEGALEAAYQLYLLIQDPIYIEKAFHIMEKSKYMLLFKALWEADHSGKIGVPEHLLKRESSIKMELASLRKKLELNENTTKPNLDYINKMQQKIFDLINLQDLLKNEVHEKYSNYYQIKYDSILINLHQAQAQLDHHSQIINYYWGDSAVYLIGVESSGIKFHSIPVTQELTKDLEAYRQLTLTKPKLDSKADEKTRFDTFQMVAHRLFHRLLAPMLNANPDAASKIIIIPDGPLSHIPFESLLTAKVTIPNVDYRKLQYLKNLYSISYSYSANLMFRSSSRINEKVAEKEILAFGYSNDPSNLGENSLPGSAKEIEVLKATMTGQFYMGSNASKTVFKRNAPEFNILHLAVHGTADLENALNSKLVFPSSSEKDTTTHLYAYELYNLNLSNTRLAVLSACETGIGKQFKGEGTYSIARGFAYAGVSSLVMSLWKVDDEASSILMKQFYQGIKQGMSIDRSMDIAKDKYLNQADPFHAHPAYWAAFIPIGDMRPIQSSYKIGTKTQLAIILGLAILITLAVVLQKKKSAEI